MIIEINVIATDDVKCKVLNSPKLLPIYIWTRLVTLEIIVI